MGIAPSEHSEKLIVPCAAGALRTKEAALQALGCLGIARPSALLATGAQGAMREALQRSAPALLKMRGLHNLAELLKARRYPLPGFCLLYSWVALILVQVVLPSAGPRRTQGAMRKALQRAGPVLLQDAWPAQPC